MQYQNRKNELCVTTTLVFMPILRLGCGKKILKYYIKVVYFKLIISHNAVIQYC